jgi:hypothetical protein
MADGALFARNELSREGFKLPIVLSHIILPKEAHPSKLSFSMI